MTGKRRGWLGFERCTHLGGLWNYRIMGWQAEKGRAEIAENRPASGAGDGFVYFLVGGAGGGGMVELSSTMASSAPWAEPSRLFAVAFANSSLDQFLT